MIRSMMGRKKVDKNTLLLLHFDGNLADATGINSGLTSQNITYSTDSKFGESVKFGNSGSWVKIPFNKNLLYTPGQDMTVDFWLKRGRSDDYVISLYGNQDTNSIPNGFQFSISNDELAFYTDGDTNGFWIKASIPLNTWTHIALVYINNEFHLYKNGIRISTFKKSATSFQNGLLIGQARDCSYSLNGCIDEYRISNIARWTSNFTPPARPY